MTLNVIKGQYEIVRKIGLEILLSNSQFLHDIEDIKRIEFFSKYEVRNLDRRSKMAYRIGNQNS
jgi:hypothetical protein